MSLDALKVALKWAKPVNKCQKVIRNIDFKESKGVSSQINDTCLARPTPEALQYIFTFWENKICEIKRLHLLVVPFQLVIESWIQNVSPTVIWDCVLQWDVVTSMKVWDYPFNNLNCPIVSIIGLFHLLRR